jgi:hypothetical protein
VTPEFFNRKVEEVREKSLFDCTNIKCSRFDFAVFIFHKTMSDTFAFPEIAKNHWYAGNMMIVEQTVDMATSAAWEGKS